MKNRFGLTLPEVVIAAVVVVVLLYLAAPRLEKKGAAPGPAAARDSAHTNVQSGRPRQSRRSPASVESDGDALDREVQNLKKGNLAYNTPEKMKTGETARVVARIGSEKIPVSSLTSGMPDDGRTNTVSTPVSTKMKMSLKSADFDITPLSSEEQFITGNMPTIWAWDITPKHSGKLNLHLAAVVELNGLSKDFTTVDRDIDVQVDALNAIQTFIQSNTVWVLGVLGAAATAMWGWFRKKGKASGRGDRERHAKKD